MFTGLSMGAWIWIGFLYWLRMLAITAIYHRLLTHKAYRSPALVKWIGSFIACSAGQMGPSWWKGHHEDHHRFTDTAGDPHSSANGFWWTQYRWLLSKNFLPSRLPLDIEQDVTLRTLDRLHFLPLFVLGWISYLVGGLEYLAAFFVSTVLLFHCVALVNSVCHKFGSTPFATNDVSKNNWLVSILTLGEGWHNFHHAFPWSARQGITVVNGSVSYLS
ncbi:acyl-CoA desaturase, partial [Leptolyngbya ectocarpi]